MNQQNNNIFSDETYPIEPIWVLKNTFNSLLLLFFGVPIITFILWLDLQANGLFVFFLIFFILFVPLHFIINVIRRSTFHYTFGDSFLSIHQGMINKKNRQLHYGVIQNIIMIQSILDRIFGLTTIAIQNSSPPNAAQLKAQATRYISATPKFFGNITIIPGLTKENAEIIKAALLKKIKETPIEELGM